MTKFLRFGGRMDLISAACVDHIKGYVYIEARNNAVVKNVRVVTAILVYIFHLIYNK